MAPVVIANIAVAAVEIASKVMGMFGGSAAAKQQKNYENDIQANAQHAANFFGEIRSKTSGGGGYAPYLTPEEIDALEKAGLQAESQNPYLGGLGQSYTSKITGTTFGSVPSVGLAQIVDQYIQQRDLAAKSSLSEPVPNQTTAINTNQPAANTQPMIITAPAPNNATSSTQLNSSLMIGVGIVAIVLIAFLFMKKKGV